MRVDKDRLRVLAEGYDKTRERASLFESRKREIGKEIVGICAEAKKRRVQLDGWTIGYDVRDDVKVDEDSVRPVLKEMGIYKQVTTRVVDQDKLAKALESMDPARYKQIVDCMKRTRTRYPHVRKDK